MRVDGDRLLGDEGDGLRQVFHGLNPERIIGAAAGNGIADLWWMARVLRTAPVSREMILNYVAEHSLRLPRSY